MSFIVPQMLQDGQDYMKAWPMQKQLYALFPECRVIAATKFGIKVMPALAVICVALHLNYFGMEHLSQAIATGIFFLSLPVQGLLWLGHRSQQALPPAIESWYRQIYETMQTKGCALESLKPKPKFKELALLLKTAFNEMDRAFTKHMF
jgi:uncharacterized membrane protein YfbV (UPF0208 family)